MGKISKKKNEIVQKVALPEYLLIASIVNFIVITFVIVTKSNLPPVVPLFYGVAYGSDRLVSSNFLILPSLLSLFFISINSIISFFVDDVFLKKTLTLAGLAATIFSVITVFNIILIVGNY